MNLQPIDIPSTAQHFTTFCVRCGKVVGSWEAKADRDGCAYRSYFCESCAKTVTPEEAAKLATVAYKLIHTNF